MHSFRIEASMVVIYAFPVIVVYQPSYAFIILLIKIIIIVIIIIIIFALSLTCCSSPSIGQMLYVVAFPVLKR